MFGAIHVILKWGFSGGKSEKKQPHRPRPNFEQRSGLQQNKSPDVSAYMIFLSKHMKIHTSHFLAFLYFFMH